MLGGFELDLLLLLTGIAFVAGAVDAVAGGGGLIIIPALLLSGLDPVAALATSKLQASFGSGSATFAFARARCIHWPTAWPMALAAFIGSVIGTGLVKLLPREALQILIPFLLIAVAVYFALSPKIRDEDAQARLTPLAFTFTGALGVGFYDGLFGPGAGSFYMLGFVLALGYGVVKATAHAKLLNFGSNLGSLIMFAFAGVIVWPLGLAMGAAQLLGAQLGSWLALKLGAQLIRPLLIVMCLGLAIRLLADPTHPVRRWLAAPPVSQEMR